VKLQPKEVLWYGHNPNKGLAIFSYSDFKLKVLDVYDDSYKLIIPIKVSNINIDFNLFAIWANNPTDPDGQYVTQIWKAIHYYDNLLTNKQTILIGDFNSNTIWDRPRREGNHSTVVDYLNKKGIHSLYHKHFKQTQGKEKHPTLYMYRHKNKPYHIDYCFASKTIADKLRSVKIGDYDFWMQHSDHAPVIVTFKL
jgi:exonuclease III